MVLRGELHVPTHPGRARAPDGPLQNRCHDACTLMHQAITSTRSLAHGLNLIPRKFERSKALRARFVHACGKSGREVTGCIAAFTPPCGATRRVRSLTSQSISAGVGFVLIGMFCVAQTCCAHHLWRCTRTRPGGFVFLRMRRHQRRRRHLK